MLNLIVEKRASNDRDRSGSSITWPRTSTPTRFACPRSRLDFGLGTSLYTVDVFYFSFSFLFSFPFSLIIVALTSSPRASLSLTLAMHSSIYFLIFPSYYLYFISINLIISSIF